MLDTKFVFNWIVTPVIVLIVITVAASKMCETMTVLNEKVASLNETVVSIKKNTADAQALINPNNTITDKQTIDTSVRQPDAIFNDTTGRLEFNNKHEQGQWIFNKQ